MNGVLGDDVQFLVLKVFSDYSVESYCPVAVFLAFNVNVRSHSFREDCWSATPICSAF